jgi:hypothetical protein
MRIHSVTGKAVAAGAVLLVGLAVPVGASLFSSTEDLPDGSAAAPAAPTPADTTSVQGALHDPDVDAFLICVTDPVALHLTVTGIDGADAPTGLDTMVWLFDADGVLKAMNDDRTWYDPSSEIASPDTGPGLHTVAVGSFRSRPLDANGEVMWMPGHGPLHGWDARSGFSGQRWEARLMAGATGSAGCGEPPEVPDAGTGHAVMTGNGRCQELGGAAVGAGKGKGLEKAAEHRQNETC